MGLAASVVVFSFLNAFLLRPLPHADSARLVVIYEHSVNGGRANSSRLTYGNAVEVRERATSFSRTGIFRNESVTIHADDATEVTFVQRVTADVFPMMGARAALGTVISPANLESGGLRAALLSDALWRRRFGADPAVVGRIVRLDETNHVIVGVMPADFTIPTGDDNPQAWLALLPSGIVRSERTQRRHHVWGELAPGGSLESADQELAAIGAVMRQEFPRENVERSLLAIPLRDDLLGGFGRPLLLLQGAVLLVLVVACFNCFCLLIARAIQHRREFAVRLALGGIYAVNSFFVARRMHEFGVRAGLGATQRNLLALAVRDSLRLTAVGLGAGLVLALAVSRSLTGLLYQVPALDVSVYAAAVTLMTIACVGATLLPARRAARVDPLLSLRAE